MEIKFTDINGIWLGEVISTEIEINTLQDALTLLGECFSHDARKLILHEKNISPLFFDLKTGLAGEILQKFVNYDIHLAIVGDFSKYSGKSLKDFIYESNKNGDIHFVNSVKEAEEVLVQR